MLPGRGPAAFVTSFSLLTYVKDLRMLIKLVVIVTIGVRVPATVTESVAIAPNGRVFDLPAIVGIEEGTFERHGLDVSFSAGYEHWMRSRGLAAGGWRPDTLVDVR